MAPRSTIGSHSPSAGRSAAPRSLITAARTIAATENRMPSAVAESTPEAANARPMTVAIPYATAPTAARPTPTTPLRSRSSAVIDNLGDRRGEPLPLVIPMRDDPQCVGPHAMRRAQHANSDTVPAEHLSDLGRAFAESVLKMPVLVGAQVETRDPGQCFGKPGVVGVHLNTATIGPRDVSYRGARDAYVDPR